ERQARAEERRRQGGGVLAGGLRVEERRIDKQRVGLEKLRRVAGDAETAAEIEIGGVANVGDRAALIKGRIVGVPGHGDVVDEIAVVRVDGGKGAGVAQRGIEVVLVAS